MYAVQHCLSSACDPSKTPDVVLLLVFISCTALRQQSLQSHPLHAQRDVNV